MGEIFSWKVAEWKQHGSGPFDVNATASCRAELCSRLGPWLCILVQNENALDGMKLPFETMQGQLMGPAMSIVDVDGSGPFNGCTYITKDSILESN